MTNRLACSLMLVVALAASLTAQTIRIGAVAASSATDADVLVLHEVDASGKPYGTMPMRYVTEIRQRAGALLDIAIVEPRYGGPSLYLTRQAALAAAKPSVLTASPNAPVLIAGEANYNALSVLRLQPVLGRDFSAADVEQGRQLVVLTDAGWQRVFGGRSDVLGQIVWTSRPGVAPQACEIIGVLASDAGTRTPELDPSVDALVLAQTLFETPLPDERAFAPVVRLKPGVSLDAARAAIDDAVTAAQRAMGSQYHAGGGARLDTLRR